MARLLEAIEAGSPLGEALATSVGGEDRARKRASPSGSRSG
jgi:hypothetical protein